jgi:nicotinic acid mononucleotide adenylyltransferase
MNNMEIIDKINEDYYYADLYKKYGREFLEEAGWFPDTSEIGFLSRVFLHEIVTPVNHLIRDNKLKNANKPCVLINTGSFCPMHAGHIEMMECAKRELEQIGFDVVGGYLSPGHDEYIFSKNKEQAIPINYRIQLINDAIKDIDWLSVDPWEGIFTDVAINFTEVVRRLELYLKDILGHDVPVFFVCGGDNARFALSFLDKGNCVVVNRPGYEDRFNKYKEQIGYHQDRIFFAEGGNSMSSTEVRKTFKWNRPQKKKLQLRVSNHDLDKEIIELLKPHYSSINLHDMGIQRMRFWDDNHTKNVISLDSLIDGPTNSNHSFNLEISRKYDFFGMNKLGYTRRPGSKPFSEQIEVIDKAISYYLFDDDIHTGGTMRFAKKLLEDNGIRVCGIKSSNINNSEDEILDARDFIFGLKNSGLVIQVPGGHEHGSAVRVPYVYPFVDPTSRCSIDKPLDFSIQVWEMNVKYWSKFSDTLADRPHLWKLFNGINGVGLETKISDICKYYANYLINLKHESRQD